MIHFDAYFDGYRFNSIHKSMVFNVYLINIRYIDELKFSFWYRFSSIVTRCISINLVNSWKTIEMTLKKISNRINLHYTFILYCIKYTSKIYRNCIEHYWYIIEICTELHRFCIKILKILIWNTPKMDRILKILLK